MNYDNFFDDVDFNDITFNDLEDISDDQELNENPFYDKFSTAEQKQRDKYVTTLLKSYVYNYENKTILNMKYKGKLFHVFLILTCILTLIFSACIVYVFVDLKNSNIAEYLIKILPICVTFVTLIIGTLNIIVKYVFPEKEEEYITKIVEIIQNNDLENKKENIRSNQINQSNTNIDTNND